jgi:voltage-gated potassium channel
LILEPETVKSVYGDGIWWAIVTATTVGYSDISPSTLGAEPSRFCWCWSGSTLAASITSYLRTANSEY